MKAFIHTFLIIGFLACCSGCGSPAADEATADATADAATFFTIQIGAQTAELQLALNDAERAKGLMHRTSLEEHHGMLFLFNKAERRSFWMRNTPLKLDIGFFDQTGKLLETHSLYPFDETAVKSYSENVLIAVEMNHGWFAKNKIRPGARIHLDHLREAIQKRGQAPGAYPLLDVN
jgi:uncharacterized membrane protein (UPF0127 family)